MAHYWSHRDNVSILIPRTEQVDSVTFYEIVVCVGDIKWSVLRRYSEFYRLHNALVVDHGVAKDILPPKKVLNNRDALFIETRRIKLYKYLSGVSNYLSRTMPRIFVEFLDFHIYDVYFISQRLANLFFSQADTILSKSTSYMFDCVELHAIGDCLKNPFPSAELTNQTCDFSHTLDFCLQLTHLTVIGIDSKYYKNSNIEQSSLSFEMSPFKCLESWEVDGVCLDGVTFLGNLRSCLQKFTVHKTSTKSISQILQCDILHKTTLGNNNIWSSIRELNLSENGLTEIDDSIRLVPCVRILKLDNNKITEIPDLATLTELVYLSLSDNEISACKNLHTKLGNVELLDVSQNKITTLIGFSKLYSLITLDLSCNKLSKIEDTAHLSQLDCLENLRLTGNPVATVVDYRAKVLEHLPNRARYICLDNERPGQQELDKASLLRALRILNKGKSNASNSA